MALAALLVGTVAGIVSFALALVFGQSLLVAFAAWWVVGTAVTVLPLVAAALLPDADELPEDLVTA